jgi:hypothetical protein
MPVHRAHLLKLARARYGASGLPETAGGRDFATALLACGATAHEALKLAPWLDPDVDAIIEEVNRLGARHFTPLRLGETARLTDKERTDHRLWSLRPNDIAWHIVQERRRAAKSAYNSGRNKRRRAKARAIRDVTADLDVRAEALSVALDGTWKSLPAIASVIGKGKAWRGPNGRLLTGNSLRQAFKRAADDLVNVGRAESTVDSGRRGQPVRFLRLLKGPRSHQTTLFCHRDTVTASVANPKNAKNPHKH